MGDEHKAQWRCRLFQMASKGALPGYDDVAIRKMGCWAPRSLAFLEHIQQQLSSFSDGMSTKMSQIATFSNMEGNRVREDLRQQTIF